MSEVSTTFGDAAPLVLDWLEASWALEWWFFRWLARIQFNAPCFRIICAEDMNWKFAKLERFGISVSLWLFVSQSIENFTVQHGSCESKVITLVVQYSDEGVGKAISSRLRSPSLKSTGRNSLCNARTACFGERTAYSCAAVEQNKNIRICLFKQSLDCMP
jgi:hypothetical protein